MLYAARTAASWAGAVTTCRMPDAPVATIMYGFTPGALLRMAVPRLFVKMVSPSVRNAAAPKVWKKLSSDMEMETIVGGSEFWTAIMGICIPMPRPKPSRIWYPIHFAVVVDEDRVDRSPLPTADSTALPRLQGR